MNKKSSTRLRVVLLLCIGVFLFIIIRLVDLQIINHEEYKKEALDQWTRGETIKPKRGYIYDRNGKKLAVNKNASTLWVDLSQLKPENKGRVAKGLSEILEIDEENLKSKLKKKSGHEKIKQWITEEELVEINKFKEELRADKKKSGLYVTDDYVRYYPYGKFASHVLGFTDIDNNGLYGVEQTYDKYLLGSSGKWVRVTDKDGKQLPFEEDKIFDVEDGLSLVLTIDETIQQFAEKAVEKSMRENNAKNITVIAMEPKTGDVLALVNKPDYNPNEPRVAQTEAKAKRWKELEEEGNYEALQKEWYESWRNYGINDIYEPGSTFKLVTAAAAIEENRVHKHTPFYCNGFIRDIKGVELKCSSWYNPHRDLTFQQGMDSSCNIVFVNTARKLGKDQFLRYIRAFGFGEKSGIDLNGEEYGLIPSDLKNIKDVQLATMSYGHGIAVTPIQMVNAVNTIANGGNLMTPRIVKGLVDENGKVVKEFKPEIRRKVISEETSREMLELMETVVSKGSGKKAKIPGYRIGGKTGTAEKAIDGVYVDGKYIGSFAAVAPVDDPKIVLLVIVDDPDGVYYGGTTAAPIAKEIIEGTLNYLEIEPAEEGGDKKLYAEDIVEIPNLVGKTISEAGEILSKLNLRHMTNYVEIDSDSIIVEQSPEPGKRLEKGTVVDLKIDDGPRTVKVPDLSGKTKGEIIEVLEAQSLLYNIEGEGVCTEQTPEAGTEVEKETTVNIKLE